MAARITKKTSHVVVLIVNVVHVNHVMFQSAPTSENLRAKLTRQGLDDVTETVHRRQVYIKITFLRKDLGANVALKRLDVTDAMNCR